MVIMVCFILTKIVPRFRTEECITWKNIPNTFVYTKLKFNVCMQFVHNCLSTNKNVFNTEFH